MCIRDRSIHVHLSIASLNEYTCKYSLQSYEPQCVLCQHMYCELQQLWVLWHTLKDTCDQRSGCTFQPAHSPSFLLGWDLAVRYILYSLHPGWFGCFQRYVVQIHITTFKTCSVAQAVATVWHSHALVSRLMHITSFSSSGCTVHVALLPRSS